MTSSRSGSVLSLVDALHLLRPELAAWLTEEALARLQTVAHDHPYPWRWGCIEMRLDKRVRVVDFSIGVSRADFVARAESVPRAPSALAGLQRQWCNDGSPERTHVPAAWLEYDLPTAQPSPPFLFYVIDDPCNVANADPRVQVIGEILANEGTTRAFELAAHRHVRRVIGALPAGARVLHVASLPVNRGGGVRLVVLVARSEIESWLIGGGWSGSSATLAQLLEFAEPDVPLVQVQVDVRHSIGEKIGVETYVSPRAATWPNLLTKLTQAGLCTRDDAQTLAGFRGGSTMWCESLGRYVAIARRFFCKVTCSPWQAKAYLAFAAHDALSVDHSARSM